MIGRVAGAFLVLAGAYLAWYGVYEIRDAVDSDPAIDRVTGWSGDLAEVLAGRALRHRRLVLAIAIAGDRSAVGLRALGQVSSRSSSSSSP